MSTIKNVLKAQMVVERIAGPAMLSGLLLFMRIIWGWGFFSAGKGKLMDISKPIAFFTELGIPVPAMNAWFVSSLKCFGGLLLLFGLFSRPIALLLMGNRIVALLTAHRTDVFPPLFNEADPSELFKAAPFWFLVTSMLVLALGPGKFSVDSAFKWRLGLLVKREQPAVGVGSGTPAGWPATPYQRCSGVS